MKSLLQGLLLSSGARAVDAMNIVHWLMKDDLSRIAEILNCFQFMEDRGLYNQYSAVVNTMLQWEPESQYLKCRLLTVLRKKAAIEGAKKGSEIRQQIKSLELQAGKCSQ